jgi:hypothetical protein
MSSEPVLTAATIGAITAAALQLVVVFGMDLGPDLVEVILSFVTVVAPVLLAAWYARQKVTPTDKE